jgi:hypothetical protein
MCILCLPGSIAAPLQGDERIASPDPLRVERVPVLALHRAKSMVLSSGHAWSARSQG